jgi:hypothetical protein
MMDKCREAFEKWAKGYVPTERVYKMDGNTVLEELEDYYTRLDTQLTWMAYKAAWNAKPVSPEVGDIVRDPGSDKINTLLINALMTKFRGGV